MDGGLIQWLEGFATDYQVWATLISTSVGFAGVIAAIVLQHKSDRFLAEEREQEERARLIAAIRTELVGITSFASQGAKLFAQNPQGETKIPTQAPVFVFEALAHKLDLLTEHQIQALTHCYLFLKEMPHRLALLPGGSITSDGRYVSVIPLNNNTAHSLLQTVAALAEAALERLGNQR